MMAKHVKQHCKDLEPECQKFLINVFESACKSGYGSAGGPYFNNPDGQDGYAQPSWFLTGVPKAKVGAFVHSVPNAQADIDRAIAVAKQKGVGNLYLTDRMAGTYYFGGPPSAGFMAKFFSALRAS